MPTFDVGSDIYLSLNTYNFAGDELEMAGCRVCYSKSKKEINDNKNANSCNVCVSDRYGYGHSGIYCSAKPSALDQISRLQSSTECEIGDWHMNVNETLKNGTCVQSDDCCVHVRKKLNSSQIFSPGHDVDSRIAWVFCRNKALPISYSPKQFGGCEACLGIGVSTSSKCIEPYNNFSSNSIVIHNDTCSSSQSYVLTNSINGTMGQFQQGKCRFEDGCCLNLRKTNKPANLMRCNEDICMQHIHISMTSSSTDSAKYI